MLGCGLRRFPPCRNASLLGSTGKRGNCVDVEADVLRCVPRTGRRIHLFNHWFAPRLAVGCDVNGCQSMGSGGEPEVSFDSVNVNRGFFSSRHLCEPLSAEPARSGDQDSAPRRSSGERSARRIPYTHCKTTKKAGDKSGRFWQDFRKKFGLVNRRGWLGN